MKIQDKERLEPPHVTILHRTEKWRLNLRTGEFMDREPSSRDVSKSVLEDIRQNLSRLQQEWDRLHPTNPVRAVRKRR